MIKMARKIIVLVIGLTVLLIGVALIALPGPAIIVIPLGLAILGTEFIWARRVLQKVKEGGEKLSSILWEVIFLKGKRPHKNNAA
jgi:tellurite resistance protein TerC